MTQSFLLSPVVVHKVQGRLSKSLLSLWRRLSHPSTESPCVVHTVYSLTQRCPLSHTVVAAAQQTLAELVEGDLAQRLKVESFIVGPCYQVYEIRSPLGKAASETWCRT